MKTAIRTTLHRTLICAAIRLTLAAIVLAVGLPPSQAAQPKCDLGVRWVLNEPGWNMTWIREGQTNNFNVEGKRAGSNDVTFTAKQTITMKGDQVEVNRTESSDSNPCTFKGSVQDDGVTVKGKQTCTGTTKVTDIDWTAKIECQ